MPSSIADLPAFDPKSGHLNVIVETPRGSRNKFKFDPDTRLFTLSGVLPVGHSFPFDFGFVPSTRGEDGDPLDVLVLMDEPAFAGCHLPCRLIGVLEADQTERGKTRRNDRLVAVFANSRVHENIRSLDDLNPQLKKEIEHFFVSYNQPKGKTVKIRSRRGPDRARKLVKAGEAEAKRES